MATTTNYGFEIPDDTDLVKDGAAAMRELGQDVDTTLGTALNAKSYSGLVLVKKQTVGAGVSSVNVTSAFSATYENYKIIYNGGTSSVTSAINFKLGASITTYYGAFIYTSFAGGSVLSAGVNNGSSWAYAGGADVNTTNVNCDVMSPFLAKYSQITCGGVNYTTNRGIFNGSHETNTSYTDFTLFPSSGTITGGTIYVYGYGAS